MRSAIFVTVFLVCSAHLAAGEGGYPGEFTLSRIIRPQAHSLSESAVFREDDNLMPSPTLLSAVGVELTSRPTA